MIDILYGLIRFISHPNGVVLSAMSGTTKTRPVKPSVLQLRTLKDATLTLSSNDTPRAEVDVNIT